jgi:hypothetical protein
MGPDKNKNWKQAKLLRKNWRIQNTDTVIEHKTQPKSVQASAISTSDGRVIHSRSEWKVELINFCRSKYERAPTFPTGIALEEMFQRREEEEAPQIRIPHVLKARAGLKTGKTPGADCVSAEMLMLAPITFMYHLALVFQDRLAHSHMDQSTWRDSFLSLIRKPNAPRIPQLQHFRGIMLLSVLQKLYLSVLLQLCLQTAWPKSWTDVPTAGIQGA